MESDDGVGGVVPIGKYRAQLHKIDELNQIIEGLFTNEIKHIAWKEEVEKLTKEKEEAESKYSDAVARFAAEKAGADHKHQAEREALESEHLSKVAELEDTYEDRLKSTTSKIATLEHDHRAAEECLLKKMNEKDEEHLDLRSTLVSNNNISENKLKEEIDSLIVEVDTSEKMRHCMLAQQEEEYEKELSLQSFEHKKSMEDKQREIDEVNVQVQKLVAKRAWLERQAKELKSQVIDVQTDLVEETQRCKKLEGEINRIKCTLEQTEDGIEQTKARMNAINAEKNNLEKELYITRTRCQELETERAPLEQTIRQKKDESSDLTKQVQQSRSQTDALHRIVEVHEQKVRSRDSEIKSLRGTVRNLERKIHSFEGTFVELSGINDDKALRNEVNVSYRKFVKGEVTLQINHNT